MFKKLIITGAAAALMLSAAAGAFASDNNYHFYDPGSSVTITGTGTVSNTVNTSANTGYNVFTSTGGSVDSSGITTGAANSGANVQNQVNFNQFSCGCVLGNGLEDLTLKITGTGTVGNTINTSANTGYNVLSVSGGDPKNYDFSWFGGDKGKGSTGVTGSWITTGAAGSSSVVSNVVNTNVFGTTQ